MAKHEPWRPTWSTAKQSWIVDFRLGDKRVRKRLPIEGRSMEKAAKKLAAEIYRAAWKEDAKTGGRKNTFAEAARLYIQNGGEERFMEKIVNHLGPKVTVDEIDDLEIARIGEAIYPAASPDTVRRQVRVPIKAVLNFADGKRRVKLNDNKRARWLTPAELERLLLAASDPAGIGLRDPNRETLRKIAFMVGTGAGPGETMSLTVSGWNPSTREWWLPGTKSVFRHRYVRLPLRTLDLIQPIPQEGIAFPAPNGQPYKMRKNGGGQMAAAFKKVRDAAGLDVDVDPYVLRHTWATYFYAQTKDWAGLLDQGGWNRSDTANRYRKVAPADLGHVLLRYGWDFRPERHAAVKFGELVALTKYDLQPSQR